jgi:hypothetical protein
MIQSLKYKVLAFSGALAYGLIQVTIATAQTKHTYPPELVSKFTAECAAQAGKTDPALMQALCTCTINEIQNRYSLEEFREMGMAVDKGTPVPKEFEEISYACATKIISGQSK